MQGTMGSIMQEQNDIYNLIMSDVIYFHFNNFVNKQNCMNDDFKTQGSFIKKGNELMLLRKGRRCLR